MDLISSGSTDTYKENKNNYFRNHFGSPISVPPHFEVGLSEISYIPAIETLNFDGKIEIFDFLFKHDSTPVTYGKYYEDCTIKKGYYKDSQALAHEINSVIGRLVPRLALHPIFRYCPISQKFYVDAPVSLFCSIHVFGKLIYTLGITDDPNQSSDAYIIVGNDKKLLSYEYHGEIRKFYDDENEWESDLKGRTSADYLSQVAVVDTFHVYIDIIEPIIGPDGNFTIIRTCSIQDSDKRVIERYESPHYMPLSKKYFDTITVAIKDLWGNGINFISGFSRLKLHFRPRAL